MVQPSNPIYSLVCKRTEQLFDPLPLVAIQMPKTPTTRMTEKDLQNDLNKICNDLEDT